MNNSRFIKKVTSVLILIFILMISTNEYAISQKVNEFIITDYGAIGDGTSLNTSAIQKTIDMAHNSGGGKVIVPKGKFLTGTLELKSNIELEVQKEGVLLGSPNPSHYRALEMLDRPESPKKDDNSQLALIVAYKATNISLSGGGTIDGQGRSLALNIDSLHHAGIVVDPNYSYSVNRPNERMRPKLIRFSTSENIKLSNLNFKNSACWGLSFELCTNLAMDKLNINNRAYWNNDGMDITDSRNVRVTNCKINSADDGICLKSYYLGHFNDSIYIANCVINTGASAIKFGTASYGGFKNVTINNIEVFDTFRSAIALECVDGGVIENIDISDINAKNTGNAIFIRLGHRDGKEPGSIKNVHIKDVKVQVPFARPDINYDLRARQPGTHHNPIPSSITGIPGKKVENVILENIAITVPGRSSKGQAYIPLSDLDRVPEQIKNYPEFTMFGELPSWGIYVRHANNIVLKNVTLKHAEDDFRPALIFDDVEGISLKRINLPSEKNKDQIILKASSNFREDEEIKHKVRITD
ncbi:glycoside hydrolase family 28 protein [Echinicola shivajiensis]|uniref:glycoside hydrolase family 28 protein n=1 Tax=Echinicola shivajiensis TaxID=1035916 RepID=UPI001BFC0AD9|nr:glycosyl hydrolase family 28 protein [Echinicola shivajiensis]